MTQPAENNKRTIALRWLDVVRLAQRVEARDRGEPVVRIVRGREQ